VEVFHSEKRLLNICQLIKLGILLQVKLAFMKMPHDSGIFVRKTPDYRARPKNQHFTIHLFFREDWGGDLYDLTKSYKNVFDFMVCCL
jgi:hypothetical protein